MNILIKHGSEKMNEKFFVNLKHEAWYAVSVLPFFWKLPAASENFVLPALFAAHRHHA
jgi:hypothetical protein